MPLHRITSGPQEDDLDVLERAVKQIETTGEELVGPPIWKWLNYPIGQWVILTRKAGPRTAVKRSASAEKRKTL